jgi:hypothetical protein
MTQKTTKKTVLAHVRGYAELVKSSDFVDEVYPDYDGEGEYWDCPCCRGEGEVRTTPKRIENRRKTRSRKFAAKALRLNRDYRQTLRTEPGSKFDKSLGRLRKVSEADSPKLWAFQAKLQAKYDRLNAAVSASTVNCPVCAACAERDESYADAVQTAVDDIRAQDDEYQRSEDSGENYAYMVESYQTSEALESWFDNNQSYGLPNWKDLPESLRERIVDDAINQMDMVFVSGYSSGFDCTFDSYSIGESECQFDADEFRGMSEDLEGCPDRIIELNSESNYDRSHRYPQVRIYNCNEYDHWSFGLDDEPLAQLIIDIIDDADNCEGMKRRDIESLRDSLREITGEDIELDGDLAEVWVSYQDSIDGGNCRPGTRAYMAKHNLPIDGHVRAVDMPEKHLREVRKAIRAATIRHRRELAQGYGELKFVSAD